MASQLGRYKIPRPMQDEDKWFKYFTKRQLVYSGIALIITIRLGFWVKDLKGFIQTPVMTVGMVLLICSFIFGMITMPTDRYLWGGGISLERLALRVIRKRFKSNRILYVRNYRPDRDTVAIPKEKKSWKDGKVGELVDRVAK